MLVCVGGDWNRVVYGLWCGVGGWTDASVSVSFSVGMGCIQECVVGVWGDVVDGVSFGF